MEQTKEKHLVEERMLQEVERTLQKVEKLE